MVSRFWQSALVPIWKAFKERAARHESEDRVAQEFELLVVFGTVGIFIQGLMRVRAVRQGARQEVDFREPMSEQLFESRQVLGMFFHFLVVFFAGGGPPVSDT